MLKLNLKISMILFAIMAAIFYFLYDKSALGSSPSLSPAQEQLAKMGDRCLDFGERAVASDVPIIEFQMLVRLAKKTNVIERCMADNGYKQNPAWLKYAQPIANDNAAKNKISVSEALTSLSRADMQIFTPVANRPDYWVKK
ncbi:MAG: hypothetical protein K2V71_05680 [Methylotenera sp.]|nr:hypothetical protein [Methylotenera sp.]OQW68625.1 MAG: hypothetical protein BVN34_08000 [Proteobacteria bacterium ST_bin12]